MKKKKGKLPVNWKRKYKSFTGPEAVEKIQCWDRATKRYVEVGRPCIVGVYDKFMGGVDMLDLFVAKYIFPLKSHWWYIHIFWHTIILAVIDAWLLYKWDCKALNAPKKKILNRRLFQAQLASSLGTTIIKPKRGWPGLIYGSPILQTGSPLIFRKRPFTEKGSPSKGTPAKKSTVHPSKDICKDMYGHFRLKTNRGRCRHW